MLRIILIFASSLRVCWKVCQSLSHFDVYMKFRKALSRNCLNKKLQNTYRMPIFGDGFEYLKTCFFLALDSFL